MPGLTIPSETPGSPRVSSASSPNTPARARRTSSSASTPQQPQPSIASSSPSQQSESPNPSSPPSTASPGPAHLAPTFTGSGTFYTPNFAADRPRFSHKLAASTIAPGALDPIDFDSNPDVLALQSTISILLMQQQRAAADMVKLKKAKEAALGDTEGFVRDLGAGNVGGNVAKGATLPKASQAQQGGDDEEEDSDEDTEDTDDGMGDATDAKPWQSLPTPQNVARMPPINWDKYAVVGSSLDLLHEEQRARPSPGTPTVFTLKGNYEPGTPATAHQGPGSSPEGVTVKKENLGVTSPFNPLVDKLHDKRHREAPATPKFEP